MESLQWWSTEYVNMESQALQMSMETRTRSEITLDKHGTAAHPVGSGRAVARGCKRRAKKMGARSAQAWMGWHIAALRERQCMLNDPRCTNSTQRKEPPIQIAKRLMGATRIIVLGTTL
tara:strand:- start:240 stop:596 length:357 start_codon:yes stop_codon:yes gene_type:complete